MDEVVTDSTYPVVEADLPPSVPRS